MSEPRTKPDAPPKPLAQLYAINAMVIDSQPIEAGGPLPADLDPARHANALRKKLASTTKPPPKPEPLAEKAASGGTP